MPGINGTPAARGALAAARAALVTLVALAVHTVGHGAGQHSALPPRAWPVCAPPRLPPRLRDGKWSEPDYPLRKEDSFSNFITSHTKFFANDPYVLDINASSTEHSFHMTVLVSEICLDVQVLFHLPTGPRVSARSRRAPAAALCALAWARHLVDRDVALQAVEVGLLAGPLAAHGSVEKL